MFWKTWGFPLTAALLTVLPQSALPGSRYFPETGRAAIHQRTLDLQGSTVVMYLALEPGHEDLPLLSRLRLASGARTVIVYVTNGDATPNDLSGESPQYTAARRKEEAFAAASLIGAQVYFLNLPDPGIVNSPQALEQIWGMDTAAVRLQRAIRSYRPDLLVVGGDLRGSNPGSVRQKLVTRLVAAASDGRALQGETAGMPPPWSVARVIAEETPGRWKTAPSIDELHPVWKKSYRAIGAEAGRSYHSLRFADRLWSGKGFRTYAQISPAAQGTRGSMLDGLPPVGKRLAPLRNLLRRAIAGRTPALEQVSATIDSAEYLIASQGNELAPDELRLVAGWKNTLEDLRCSLLGVTVEIAPTDSVVTQAQLLDLKITAVRSRAASGNLRIFFPGAREKKWGINESAEYKFDLSPPQLFRVLTPVAQEFNTPVSQFGMLRAVPRTRFSFIIYHEDTIRARNFIYRGELLLQFAPKRTFEVLTPAFRAQRDEPVVYRLVNISRDGYRGTIGFADSLALPGEKSAILEDRNQVVIDTLRFVPARDSLPEMFGVKVQLSGEGVSTRVLAKSFGAETDSTARVGLLTPYADGVAELALHRLRIPCKTFRLPASPSVRLDGLNTILLDRDAASQMPDPSIWWSALENWMEEGGHLVVLPQKKLSSASPVLDGLGFGAGDATEPMERVVRSDSHPFLSTPNVIGEDDWRNWVVARAVSGAGLTGRGGGESVVTSAATNAPYLTTAKVGKGRITLVALDLISQLTNIHPGAHRLLANLLRPAH